MRNKYNTLELRCFMQLSSYYDDVLNWSNEYLIAY